MTRNWFDQGGQSYAAFRPDYPPELIAHLVKLTPSRRIALDVGCGSGQLTRALADHFDHVIGIDPSAEQIAAAAPHRRIRYHVAAAENLPETRADLITAAQAAHWFNLPRFYAEARRIASEGAVLALISYGVLGLDSPALSARFQHFYRDEIGPYWPPERRMVDDGYASLDFPFNECATPNLSITRNWDLAAFFGYLSTWSATRHALQTGKTLSSFQFEFAAMWGDPARTRRIRWPLNTRIARL